jgi:hypothetical protein
MAVDSSLFRSILIIVSVTFSIVVFVQKLGLVLAGFVSDPSYRLPQIGVQPIDLAALTRGPVVAYGHQPSSKELKKALEPAERFPTALKSTDSKARELLL